MRSYDAIVVGAGPNGLAAGITLARAGLSVLVREGELEPGGGARTEALTLPGFLHDTFSAVHPLALASPFFESLPLAAHGLEWVHPPVPLAHPLDDGGAVLLERSLDATAEGLGEDGDAYRALFAPLVHRGGRILAAILSSPRLPRSPLALARFGRSALQPASRLVRRRFSGDRARALFAGLAAHSALALDLAGSSAFGLVLGLAGHTLGWPMPRSGAQRITRALVSVFGELGGELLTGAPVESLSELPPARVVLCDVTPRQLLRLVPQLPSGYRRSLRRWRYGPGVFKLDWALSGPIPWRAAVCRQAGTVHLGGSLGELEASERAAWEGRVSARPFVLLVQPSLFDPTRAPEGRHTAWAYCHVPNGSKQDATQAIERQVERFAPGFRDLILARSVLDPAGLEARNPNLVGGDLNGGALELRQLLVRPSWHLHSTPSPGLYLCSSSTPPGGGVHGMCGHRAAHRALREAFGRREP